MIEISTAWYGVRVRRVLCGYELGCCQLAVTHGYNRLSQRVPVCRAHDRKVRQ